MHPEPQTDFTKFPPKSASEASKAISRIEQTKLKHNKIRKKMIEVNILFFLKNDANNVREKSKRWKSSEINVCNICKQFAHKQAKRYLENLRTEVQL